MRHMNLTRIAVLSTAAAVCLGTAVRPRRIRLGGTTGVDEARPPARRPLAQEQAWIDSFIAKRQQQLAGFASKIAADSEADRRPEG